MNKMKFKKCIYDKNKISVLTHIFLYYSYIFAMSLLIALSCVYTIKVFLVKVRQRKLGQSFLRQGRLFTLSKLFDELVQENHGKCIKIQ